MSEGHDELRAEPEAERHGGGARGTGPRIEVVVRRSDPVAFSIPPFVAGILYWLAFFPAVISWDPILEWEELRAGRWGDWHPFTHQIFLAIFVWPFRSFAPVAAVQVLGFALAVGGLAAECVRRGVSRRAVWAAVGFLSLSPCFGYNTIAVWKDAPYTIAVLFMTLELSRLERLEGATGSNPFRLGIAILATCLFRHNGVITVALAVAGALLLAPRIRRTLLVTTGAALLVFGVVRGPVARALGVRPIALQASQSLLIHHVGAAVAARVPRTPEDQRDLDALLPRDAWPDYRCHEVTTVQFHDRLDVAAWESDPERVRRLWKHLVLPNPSVLLRHVSCASEYLWWPRAKLYIGPWYRGADRHDLVVVESDPKAPPELQFATRPVVPSLHHVLSRVLRFFKRTPGLQLVFQPSGALYAVLASIAFAWSRRRGTDVLLLALPALANTLPYFALAASPHVRYQLPLLLFAPFGLAMAFATRAAAPSSTEPDPAGTPRT